MWWKRKQWNNRTAETSSCKYTVTDVTDTSFLDITQHRCTSVASLLSIEQSLVMHNDENKMMLVPLVCLEGNIPAEVDVNITSDNTDDHEFETHPNNSAFRVDANGIHFEKTLNETSNVTFAALANSSISESTNDGIYTSTSSTNDTDFEPQMSPGILKRPSIRGKSPCPRRENSNTIGSVRFGAVEVHEHELELGTSMVPMRGPPIGLGWNRSSYRKFESVDEHHSEIRQGRDPRPLRQLHQPSTQRVDMYVMKK